MNSETKMLGWKIKKKQSYCKEKLNRKSTKAMSENSSNQQHQLIPENNKHQSISIPSPDCSSQEGSSAEVKYLSYLAQVIDSAPQGQSTDIEAHFHKAQFWQVVYSSAVYVKKDVYRTQIDDNLIIEEIQEYIKSGRIHPEPSNRIGQQLLTNGYFLCAYAISLARKKKSGFVFRYLMQYFQSQFELKTNYEEFRYLLDNYVKTEKAEQILHLNNKEINSNNNKQKFQQYQEFVILGDIQAQYLPKLLNQEHSINQQQGISETIVLQNDLGCNINF